MQTWRWATAVCVGCLVVGAGGARAQYMSEPKSAEPGPSIETHDGVMLRLSVGPGAGSVSQDYPDIAGLEVELGGGGLLWSFDLGAGVTDRFTVQARIGQLWLPAPKYSVRNARAGSPESEPLPGGSTVSATLVGVGVTYNIMPINVSVTAIGGLSVIILDRGATDDDDQEAPRTGFGVNLDVGKEWWVGDQVGIGVGGRFVWATGGAAYRAADFDRALLACGVVFTATYQ